MSVRNFDVVVIGAGPAGLSAATAVASAGLTCVAVDRMGPGGQLMNLGALQGMPDLEPGSMGPDLLATMVDAAMSAGVELAIDEVSAITNSDAWAIAALDERFAAKALIIATGRTNGTTGLADEARFEGLGLSHCAHCDAPLYSGQAVVVAGDDAWALEEAYELSEHAAKVTLVHPGPIEAPPDRLAELANHPNIATQPGNIVAFEGEAALAAAIVEHDGKRQTIAARGLFLYTNRRPERRFLDAALQEADGLFWAGDVKGAPATSLQQAIADGAKAGHNAIAWLASRSST